MWSSTLFSSMFQPNHFLPLVKPSSINAPTVDKNTIGSENNILTVMCDKKDAGNSSSKNPFKRKCDQAPAEAAKKEKKGTVVPEFVDRNDIGLHYQNVSGMSNDAKYDLLCNAWKPAQDYIFPTKRQDVCDGLGTNGSNHFSGSLIERQLMVHFACTVYCLVIS